MNPYEVTFIINPTLADDDVSATTDRVASLITSGGGEVQDTHAWGGKRRLAYPIDRHRDGFYVTTTFRTNPEAAHGLDAQLRLNDNIIRHLVFRTDEH